MKGLLLSSFACGESVNVTPEIKHLFMDPNEILPLQLIIAFFYKEEKKPSNSLLFSLSPEPQVTE